MSKAEEVKVNAAAMVKANDDKLKAYDNEKLITEEAPKVSSPKAQPQKPKFVK